MMSLSLSQGTFIIYHKQTYLLIKAVNNKQWFYLINFTSNGSTIIKKLFQYQTKQIMERKHKSNIIQPSKQDIDLFSSINHQHQQASTLHYSTVKKNTGNKPTRLKVHMKTEIQATPKASKEKEFVTSRKKKIEYNGRSPLAQSNQNQATHQRKNKTMITQFYTIDEEKGKHEKKLSQVLPSPKKQSVLHSKSRKQSFIETLKQEQKATPSKQKKKISFTVYDQRSKSRNKSNKSMQKQLKLRPSKVEEYLVPYRYNSSITINLFDDAKSSKSKEKRSKSNSVGRLLTKQKSLSLPRRKSTYKSITKTSANPQNTQKINKTLQALKSYKFVEEYIERSQVLEKIEGYILKNEPECKWALLIVDQVFRRIRQQEKVQNSLVK